MKKAIYSLLILVFAPFAFADSKTVEGAKQDAAAFKKEVSAQLDEIETKLTALKAQAKTKSGEAKASMVADLEKARDHIKTGLNNLSHESKEGWQTAKKNISESVSNLNTRIQKALKD